jgi:hypothetical protein
MGSSMYYIFNYQVEAMYKKEIQDKDIENGNNAEENDSD